ncbi:OmpA family protein, partial [Vibrio lentus]
MKLLKNYIALFLSALVLGCTSYPEQGTGGLAESYDSLNYQNSDFSPVMPDEPLGPE